MKRNLQDCCIFHYGLGAGFAWQQWVFVSPHQIPHEINIDHNVTEKWRMVVDLSALFFLLQFSEHRNLLFSHVPYSDQFLCGEYDSFVGNHCSQHCFYFPFVSCLVSKKINDRIRQYDKLTGCRHNYALPRLNKWLWYLCDWKLIQLIIISIWQLNEYLFCCVFWFFLWILSKTLTDDCC